MDTNNVLRPDKNLINLLYYGVLWPWETIFTKCVDTRVINFKSLKTKVDFELIPKNNSTDFCQWLSSINKENFYGMAFVNSKTNTCNSIIFHIRNAFAHAHIVRPSTYSKYIILESTGRNGVVMYGRIKKEQLTTLIKFLAVD